MFLSRADKIKRKFGEDYFQRIGRQGGKKSKGGGFGSKKVGADGLTGPERAILAGKKSKRNNKGGNSNGVKE